MVWDVADDFNITGVFIPGRQLPLQGPVVSVIHLQKGRHFDFRSFYKMRALVCLSMHACLCVSVSVPLLWVLQKLEWLSPQIDHMQHTPLE